MSVVNDLSGRKFGLLLVESRDKSEMRPPNRGEA